ncbi:hypothetical protein Gohar_011176, partial [Gossypium harknessii]|nr:hypothetical protein [Gossypium harknessii]
MLWWLWRPVKMLQLRLLENHAKLKHLHFVL